MERGEAVGRKGLGEEKNKKGLYKVLVASLLGNQETKGNESL